MRTSSPDASATPRPPAQVGRMPPLLGSPIRNATWGTRSNGEALKRRSCKKVSMAEVGRLSMLALGAAVERANLWHSFV